MDDKALSTQEMVAIRVGIVITEPPEAVDVGVNIPGAYHLYALAKYINVAPNAASLQLADLPVEFVNKIDYQRTTDDATGIGGLNVSVPAKDSPFYSVNEGLGYDPVPGVLTATFWYDGRKGKVALPFVGVPFRQGSAISYIYTKPQSTWDLLFNGGGLGPCAPDPRTGYNCVIAPSFNIRYDEGSDGTLWLIE